MGNVTSNGVRSLFSGKFVKTVAVNMVFKNAWIQTGSVSEQVEFRDRYSQRDLDFLIGGQLGVLFNGSPKDGHSVKRF